MNLFTSVEIGSLSDRLSYSDKLLLIGSCFASEVGARLKGVKFTCQVNPFGVLYNPLSIATSLRFLLENKFPMGEDFIFHEGLWHSLSFHSDFSAVSQEALQENIHRSLDTCRDVMKQVSCLFLTFGTAYVYTWKETGQVVANCHKLPEQLFRRRKLSVPEIVETYCDLLKEIWQVNPTIRVLFSVSPIRHVRDGLHENQLSKATLLLAIDELQRLYPEKLIYFPAYELLMDELRDYRFYADDMVHPSQVAVDYIWQKFTETFFDKDTLTMMKSVNEIKKMLNHRPLHPESAGYAKFLHQIVLKIETLSEKYPYFEFEKEKELCLTRLNR